MSHPAFPTSAELSAFLTGNGLLDSSQAAALPLATYAAAAAADWEERTGWQPFVQDTADVARRFNPPGPNDVHGGAWSRRGGKWVLDLKAGLLVLTSVVTGYSNSPTVPAAGSTLVQEDDFWLLPDEAPTLGRPYTRIEFAASQWGRARSIRITGKWGYTASIAEDQWLALLSLGALHALTGIIGQNSGGLIEWNEVASERYGSDPYGHFRAQWQRTVDGAVQRYLRMQL